MALGDAHVLDVVRAHALLRCCDSGGRAYGLTKEDLLERQHAGNGEQHRGILRHQRAAGLGRVPL
eukprot:1524259-Pyramimonas_sp.AAC.1